MFSLFAKLSVTALSSIMLGGTSYGQTVDIQPLVKEAVEIVVEPAIITVKEETEKTTVESPLSQEEIDLIALVTMAEAEGESEYGKRLVIDTILNRTDSGVFPDTVHGVIYQKHQFSSMWNGRVNKCYVQDDICRLVVEESILRTNREVLYFTAGRYGRYGTPMFREGNHYFSK